MTLRTRNNLNVGMHGEAFASAKYKRFAAFARVRQHSALAKLLTEIADESRIETDRASLAVSLPLIGLLDLRHRFTLLGDYSLPFAKGRKGFGAFLAKDWGINAIVVLSTGITIDITNSAARSNTGGSDRPNVISDPNSGLM